MIVIITAFFIVSIIARQFFLTARNWDPQSGRQSLREAWRLAGEQLDREF